MASKRVLIVEDDTSSRTALAELLREEGFDAVAASSGAEALAACREAVPDIVLLDYRLPDTTGLDLIGELRSQESLGCPFLLVSGSSDLEISDSGEPRFRDHAAMALLAGAAGYIPKPVDLDALLDAMNRALDDASN
jgi:CheY-like chemotaxis protein